MYAKTNNTKSLSRTFSKRFFFLAKILASTTVLLRQGINVAQPAPQSLRTDVKVRNITNTLSTSPSVRIVKAPRNNTLYYLKLNVEIYQVTAILD
jgi:hypothetical protein